MKKLIIILAILACAFTANAWHLFWTVSGADGSVLFYRELGATDWQQIDVGNVTTYDVDTLGLTKGQRYEFKLQAYVGAPKSYSGDSDTLRWTYPADTSVIELPDTPKQIIFQFGDQR